MHAQMYIIFTCLAFLMSKMVTSNPGKLVLHFEEHHNGTELKCFFNNFSNNTAFGIGFFVGSKALNFTMEEYSVTTINNEMLYSVKLRSFVVDYNWRLNHYCAVKYGPSWVSPKYKYSHSITFLEAYQEFPGLEFTNLFLDKKNPVYEKKETFLEKIFKFLGL